MLKYIILISFAFSILPLHFLSKIIHSPEGIRILLFSTIYSFLILFYFLKKNNYILSKKIYFILFSIILFIIYIIITTKNINKFYIADISKLINIGLFSFVLLQIWKIKEKEFETFLYLLIKFLFILFIADVFLFTIFFHPVSAESNKFIISGITGRAFSAYNAVFFIIFSLYFFDKHKIFSYIVILLMLPIIVLSSVRLAVLMMIIVFLSYLIYKKKKKYIIILFSFLTIGIYVKLNMFLLEMFGTTKIQFNGLLDLIDRVQFTGRLSYWSSTISAYYQHIWFGNGWGYNNEMLYNLYGIEQTHNDYLRILSDLGSFGLLFYIVFFILLINQIRLSKSKYKMFLLLIITMFLIISLFDNFISYICYFFPYFLIFYKGYIIEAKKYSRIH